MCNRKFDLNNTKKIIYLNTNSTNAIVSKELNYSDIMYPENISSTNDIEVLKNKIRNLVGAYEEDEILFVSSCTEGIASIFHWISIMNPYGTICGTKFDHDTVEKNVKLYGLTYDKESLDKKHIPDNTVGIMLTQVNSTTGEILDIENIIQIVSRYKFINEAYNDDDNNDDTLYEDKVLQQKPVIIMDATQSIGKIPILMHNHRIEIDCIVASLHKLGFPISFSGIIVLNRSIKNDYIPLIAGAQQNGLRGGSYNMNNLIKNTYLLDKTDNKNKRKKKWSKIYNYLKENGLDVYKPEKDHLYNTILIDTHDECPLPIIKNLAEKYNIYVGNKTACANEDILNKQTNKENNNEDDEEDNSEKGPYTNAIRISFTDDDDISEKTLNKIIEEIKLSQ